MKMLGKLSMAVIKNINSFLRQEIQSILENTSSIPHGL